CRVPGEGPRAALRPGLRDRKAGVRQAAAHAAGLNRDPAARDRLCALVASDAPPVAREAATALGRLRRAEAVPALLRRLRGTDDRFLQHSLVFALIEIADREGTRRGLRDPDPRVRRGALVALGQMDGGTLTREQVVPL